MIFEKKNDAFVFRDNSVKSGWEQWFLLMSDEHYDSIHCDRKLLKAHHEEAVAKNAYILKFGDIFDCMGGKYDKRTSKGDLRPEYQTSKYFDTIVEDAGSFYSKYKDRILFISDGNHEQAIEKRHEINLLDRLAGQISCQRGNYNGFIRFFFQMSESRRKSFTLYYTHGGGGNSPVTRGAIKTNRRQHDFDADFYVSGHIHTSMEMSRPRVKLNEQCNIQITEPEHILLGTYKNEVMTNSWSDSKEFSAPNLGGYWLRFYYKNMRYMYEVIRAKG